MWRRSLSYRVGLDLGTTYSAAAVWRSGVANIVTLGNRSPAIPSVVHVSSSGILVGDAALGRAVSDPAHTAREFKRRLGDPEPVLRDDAGRGWSAHDLSAALASMILRTVQERQGGPPDEVVLTVPASWSATKRTLLANAIEEIPALAHPNLRTITEPEAAAIHYAANERIEPGEIVAVYDLGGGTFDAALLRRDDHVGETGAGFTLIGRPEGIDRLGGIAFDSAQ